MSDMSKSERRIKIRGVGRYLPKRIVLASEAEALCDIPEGTSSKANGAPVVAASDTILLEPFLAFAVGGA